VGAYRGEEVHFSNHVVELASTEQHPLVKVVAQCSAKEKDEKDYNKSSEASEGGGT
jgi:hypothetical protein